MLIRSAEKENGEYAYQTNFSVFPLIIIIVNMPIRLIIYFVSL